MSDYPHLPDRDAVKGQAKRLRSSLEAEGNFISHSEALELVAHQYGFRDWNTLSASLGNRRSDPLQVGARISGTYLGQEFSGEVLGLKRLNDGQRYQITLDMDTPVDVVKFDSFSAYRKRIQTVIDRDGASFATTSDGAPHLRILGQVGAA